MAPLTPNDRQRRILQLAHEWGIEHPPPQARLSRPPYPPSFRNANDEQAADDFLHRRALDAAQVRPKSGLSRAFSSNNLKRGKNADPRELADALSCVVASGGSPGVAEVLLTKIQAAGVDLTNPINRSRSAMLSRKKSMDSFVDRTHLLTQATKNNQPDMLSVLLPYADPISLDSCVAIAVKRRNVQTAELLLRYGGSLSQTADGQDAFRQTCIMENSTAMIKLILASDARPAPPLLSQGLVDCVEVGQLDSVVLLSRSSADANFNQAEALKAAVKACRNDLTLAIIMANNPPQQPGINEAFQVLTASTSMPTNARLQMAELLMCAGASGQAVAIALRKAWDDQFLDMATLLASYGASASDPFVLKDAIAKEQYALVESMLNGAAIDPGLASECVECIPKQTTPELRLAFLKVLLKSGASGDPLHQALVIATEAEDAASIVLLLKPYIRDRERKPINGRANGLVRSDGQANGYGYLGHAVASVDFRSGEALRTAVLRGSTEIATILLEARPSSETLAVVFPLTGQLQPGARYQMVRLFLQSALSGPSLHAALQEALAEAQESRDGALIQLLLDHSADINYNQGAGLHRIILDTDMQLLASLLEKASPQTAAARVPDVMDVADHRCRYEMMAMLFKSGGSIGAGQVAEALHALMMESPIDMSLLRLLLQSGNADVNALEGAIIKHSVRNPDPKVLELVLSLGKASSESVSLALAELGPMPSNEGKTWKLNIITSRSPRKEDLNSFLVNEVDALVQNRTRSPSLSTLKQLLQSGADSNAYKGAALHHAVRSADTQITDLIFSAPTKPSPFSLGLAFPHALHIADPMDRLAFSKRLIDGGADPVELNRALQYAINTYTDDYSLLRLLASAADARDGEALVLAVTKESLEVVDLVLSRTEHTEKVRDGVLTRALSISDRAARRKVCGRILTAGASAGVVSEALLIAARDGDLELSDVLMAYGATMSAVGQPIVEACRSGAADVLEVLLKANPQVEKTVLKRGFQAATEVRDLSKRAVVFEKLLKRGVGGDTVDMQLGSAARYGDPGHDLLRVLLEAGADPNYNDGDALVAATSSAFIRNFELLLGLWDESKKQKRPSGPTLTHTLKASWKLNYDTRLRMVADLMKCDLPLSDEVHATLNAAVNEEEPDHRIVKLLLDYGASPTANKCKTLIDAAQKGDEEMLALLLQGNIPLDDLSYVFGEMFAAKRFATWFTKQGLDVAGSLIKKGVSGSALSEALVLTMNAASTDSVDPTLAEMFVDLLLSADPGVNFDGGKPLQIAASNAKVTWISRMLGLHPSQETLAYAFQRLFDTALPENDALELFRLFADHQDGETRIDVTLQQPGVEPTLVRAMRSYPRKPLILETLLNAGFYHDQITSYKLHDEIEDKEEMTLLTWAIAQPQKRISPSLIQVLLDRGANPNAVSSLSRSTPLMTAIRTRQPEVVRMLLLGGAEVDVCDCKEQTPLAMATAIGGDIGTTMMISLLAASPATDDGSLHNAARALNIDAVEALIENGHHPDFPSPAHDGRSALGEVCLHGSDAGEQGFTRETAMQKVMGFLIKEGSDLTLKSHNKSLLHLCSEANDPITTTRILLKAGMWKHINKPFNHYSDGTHTYSPTMYIIKCLPPSAKHSELLTLLRSNRAQDVYYANKGPQPDDAVGLPEDMEVAERTRRARISRLAEEDEDFRLSMARRKELASVEKQIQTEKSEMEDIRRRRLHSEDLSSVRARAQLATSLEESSFQQRLAQQSRLADQATSHARMAAKQAQEAEDLRSRKALEYEGRLNTEKVDNARALTQLRLGEREEVDRIEKRAEERIKGRLDSQRKLVDSQEKLARRLAEGGVGSDQRRQIGFVEEVHGTP